MARPPRKVTKNEVKIISLFYRRGIDQKTAMQRLGVTDHHTFNTIFKTAMMTLS